MVRQGWRWVWLVVAVLAGCGGPVEQGAVEQGAVEQGPVADAVSAPESEDSVEAQWAHAPSGETRWAKRLTGPGDELAGGVAVDRDGNIVVLSGFSGSLADDEGTLVSAPLEGFVVVKYRPDGTRLWSRAFSGFASALAVDKARAVYVTGRTEPGSVQVPPKLFLSKLGRDGDTKWTRQWAFEGPSFVGERLAVDRDGNIAMAGSLEGTIHFDGHSLTGAGQAVLVKFNASGHFLWGVTGPQFSFGNALAVDEDGFLYLGGTFQTDLVGPTDFIPFIFRFSPSGTHVWEKYLDTTSGAVNGLAVHGNRVVAVGEFSAPLTFLGHTYTPDGPSDAFIVALTRSGDERWARAFGITALDVAADHQDDIIVVGRYAQGDSAGLGPLPGVGGSDFNIFVAKYDRVTGKVRWTRGFPQAHPMDVDVSGAQYRIAANRDGSSAVLGSLLAPVDFGPVTLAPEPGSRDVFLLDLKR